MTKQYDLENCRADRLDFVADFIEELDERMLYMSGYENPIDDCETAYCVIGWCPKIPEIAALQPTWGNLDFHRDPTAGKFFGWTHDECCRVVMGNSYINHRYDGEPHKAEVVKRLREAAATVRARDAEV